MQNLEIFTCQAFYMEHYVEYGICLYRERQMSNFCFD